MATPPTESDELAEILAGADLDDDEEEDDVSLGFAVEPGDDRFALWRNHFPSKLGGKPAWLDPMQLPLDAELRCRVCDQPMRFLLQVYAPINEDPRAFHRTVYLFISPRGASLGLPGAVRAFRCQLPRENGYYPFDPPDATDQPVPLTVAARQTATIRCSRFARELTGEADVQAETPTDAEPLAPGQGLESYREHQLVVEPEPSAADATTGDAQVSRLLTQYQTQQRVEADARGMARPTAGMTEAEEEPADLSAFGAPDPEVADFAAFTARLQRAPDQCLRYTHATDTQPLWASRERQPEPNTIPRCERCGGRRRFEFQVMPQALTFMGIDSMDKDAPDWATIAVYTCAASCPPTPPIAHADGQLEDPEFSSAPDAVAVVGHEAVIHGLVARPELNGQACIVLGWQQASARWGVELCASQPAAELDSNAQGAQRLSIKSGNLRLLVLSANETRREGGYAEEYAFVQTH